MAKNERRKEREQALYAYVTVKHARKIQAAFRRRFSAAAGGEIAGSASLGRRHHGINSHGNPNPNPTPQATANP